MPLLDLGVFLFSSPPPTLYLFSSSLLPYVRFFWIQRFSNPFLFHYPPTPAPSSTFASLSHITPQPPSCGLTLFDRLSSPLSTPLSLPGFLFSASAFPPVQFSPFRNLHFSSFQCFSHFLSPLLLPSFPSNLHAFL